MIGWMLRGGLRMLGLAGFLYVAIFVPIGQRTLYEHLMRIAGTSEAKELGGDLSGLADAATGRLRALYEQLMNDGSAADHITPDVAAQE